MRSEREAKSDEENRNLKGKPGISRERRGVEAGSARGTGVPRVLCLPGGLKVGTSPSRVVPYLQSGKWYAAAH